MGLQHIIRVTAECACMWCTLWAADFCGLHYNAIVLHSQLHWCDDVGLWANKVSHPSYGITKEYVVTTNQPANKKQLKDLEQGCTIEGVEVKPVGIAVEMSDPSKRNKLRIVIAEGKNREVIMQQPVDCNASLLKCAAVRQEYDMPYCMYYSPST